MLKRIFRGQADIVLKLIRDVVKEEVKKGAETFSIQAIVKKLSKTRKSITIDDESIENLFYTTYEDRYAFLLGYKNLMTLIRIMFSQKVCLLQKT